MATNTKILTYLDEERGQIVRYQCKLRKNLHYGELNEFYNFPYRMRLDSNLSSVSPLQSGKTTKDIILAFNELLSSTTKYIDFGKITSCFNEGFASSIIVQNLVGKFMRLFDFQEQPLMDATELEKQKKVIKNNSKILAIYNQNNMLETSNNNNVYQKKRA